MCSSDLCSSSPAVSPLPPGEEEVPIYLAGVLRVVGGNEAKMEVNGARYRIVGNERSEFVSIWNKKVYESKLLTVY